MFNGGLRYAPEKSKNMKNLEFDYFNGEFSIKDTDFSEVKPFSHTNVVVNCDQPLCRTNGPLERNVADFISKTLNGIIFQNGLNLNELNSMNSLA